MQVTEHHSRAKAMSSRRHRGFVSAWWAVCRKRSPRTKPGIEQKAPRLDRIERQNVNPTHMVGNAGWSQPTQKGSRRRSVDVQSLVGIYPVRLGRQMPL